MQEILPCHNPSAAASVVAEARRVGDTEHTTRTAGATVVIDYSRAAWTADLARWAWRNGHADATSVGYLIERLGS